MFSQSTLAARQSAAWLGQGIIFSWTAGLLPQLRQDWLPRTLTPPEEYWAFDREGLTSRFTPTTITANWPPAGLRSILAPPRRAAWLSCTCHMRAGQQTLWRGARKLPGIVLKLSSRSTGRNPLQAPRRSRSSLSARNTFRRDWQGRSRLLARIFRSSIIETGGRSELRAKLRNGFRTVRVLVSFIYFPFPLVHIPNGDDPNHSLADRECRGQKPAPAGLSERIESFLFGGMADIPANNQRFMEEHVFGLFRCDPMEFPAILCISVIPIETRTSQQRVWWFRHIFRIR